MARLTVQLLGGFHMATEDGAAIPIRSARHQALLARLLLHTGPPESRTELAFLFWPDSPEDQARNNLRKLIHDLRRAWPDADRFVAFDASTIAWRRDAAYTLDVEEFSEAVAHREGTEGLGRALSLYGGELLPGCYDDWLLTERERLARLFVGLLQEGIEQAESVRDYHAGIEYARRLVMEEPLYEDGYRALMRLSALSGDRAGALRAYHRCATVLRRELNVAPSTATQSLYAQLLQREASGATGAGTSTRLVGRREQWETLQHVWRTSLNGSPQVVFLLGDPGIGKTRLADELREWAERQGVATAQARCYPGEGALPLAPVAALLRGRSLRSLNPRQLRDISRLVPDALGRHPELAPPEPLTEPWQRQRFYEALACGLLATQPILVVVDDLQWCDSDTLEWLHVLMRLEPQAQLCLVCTLRPEGIGTAEQLAALWPDLRRNGSVTEIEVPPLEEAETVALARSLHTPGSGDRSSFSPDINVDRLRQLHRETEGNPLFVLETIRSGQLLKAGDARSGLPITVRSIIAARLGQLSPRTREVAGVAAVIGRAFHYPVLLGAAGGSDQEIVGALDELWQQRIVREQGFDAYDFSHDKIREVAYDRLSTGWKRLLHRRVAEALLSIHASDLDAVGAEVARHFECAGDTRRAAVFHLRAGNAARRVYANPAALAHYRVAVRHLEGEDQVRAMLELGDTALRTGDWREAETTYRQILAAPPEVAGSAARAQAQRGLGQALQMLGQYDEALVHLQAAREAYERLADDAGLAAVLSALGVVYLHMGYPAHVRSCIDGAVQAASRLADRHPLARAINYRGAWMVYSGEIAQGLSDLQRALQLAEQLDDQGVRVFALRNIAAAYLQQGSAADALEYYSQVLTLDEASGHRQAVAHTVGNIGIAHLHLGDYARAFEYLTRSVELTHALGDRAAISTSLGALASVYRRRGDVDHGLRCAQRAAVIASDIGYKGGLCAALGACGQVYMTAGDPEAAMACFVRAIDLLHEFDRRAELWSILHDAASLAIRAGQYDQAREYNTWLTRMAEAVQSPTILLAARAQAIRLAVAERALDATAGVHALHDLLASATGERERAGLHYDMWNLDRTRKDDGDAAAELYRSLYTRTQDSEYRNRYKELTDGDLPSPLPLPAPPDLVGSDSMVLKQLLGYADRLRSLVTAAT